MMSGGAVSGPSDTSIGPITYVLIPADDGKMVEEVTFAGGSDEALRGAIARHFRQQLLSQEQKIEMTKHLARKANEGAKHGDDGTAQPMINEQQSELISDYLEQTSFEIIPIVMPVRNNKFIGTSLYIDDSGRFKDLSLNSRASRIAQRDIRGDAFLLSNHDDPALDEWGRVDCTMSTYEMLLANPPSTTYHTTDREQMAALTMQRENDAKRLTEEDIAGAKKSKEDGNQFFSVGDLKAAVQAYSECVDLTEGRRDLLHNEQEVTALRIAALLNRSLCLHRLGKNDDAARSAEMAIQLDGNNLKAYHHLTVSLCSSHDYEGATRSLDQYERLGADPKDVLRIRQAINNGRKIMLKEEKKKYSKLFK
uniref:Uncharacterized protein TCIL3000_11_10400 n=1 Tax=Trypanosoma congolense (strain IL3000) TaxID=1068625 RepID=G0V1P7_TRYCI|nr:unnamed protein product [Trypanosoma congolense IL3000]